jgi:hypothetical protein
VNMNNGGPCESMEKRERRTGPNVVKGKDRDLRVPGPRFGNEAPSLTGKFCAEVPARGQR